MAKKTLLSENQIANFMKLANIRTEKAQNFKNKMLKESYTGMEGTGGMEEMEEDEPSAAEEIGGEGEMDMAAEAEPEQPTGGTIEKESDELMDMIKNAVKDALAEVGLGEEEGMEGMDMESEEEMPEEEMEEEGEEEEEEEEEEGEMEEYELQEAKKKAAKKAHNLKGGDAKKMKESLAFDNVDLVTDDEIINEVLKRVIRRIV